MCTFVYLCLYHVHVYTFLNGWVYPFASVFVLVCVLIGYMYICTSVSIYICVFVWFMYTVVYDHVRVSVSYFLHVCTCMCPCMLFICMCMFILMCYYRINNIFPSHQVLWFRT